MTLAYSRSTHRAEFFFDIIEDRRGQRTTIITAQVPVKKWHEIIGEKTMADAILDRIVHQSIRIELYGESLRKKKKINSDDTTQPTITF